MTRNQYIIPGSIDVVVLGALMIGMGYVVRSSAGIEYGRHLAIAGVAVLVLGGFKVSYDMITGFNSEAMNDD